MNALGELEEAVPLAERVLIAFHRGRSAAEDDGGAFEERAGVTRAIDNVLAMEQGAKDRRADQMGGERPADGFNLGKLGHFQKLADCRMMLARRRRVSNVSKIGNPRNLFEISIAVLDTQPKQVNNPVPES